MLPVLLGDGIPLSPHGSTHVRLRLLRADRAFPGEIVPGLTA